MKFNRRNFLKSFLTSSAGITSAGAVLGNITLMNSALAQSSSRFDDYKALVCVFLHGGNDSFNMLVPTADSQYQTYQSIRQELAYPQAELLSITPTSEQAYSLGLPPAMAPLHNLFLQGKLAFVANTGPLLHPITKAQALDNESLLPPQLFSHNDQQKHWQTSWPEQSVSTGWAGRMADLMMDTNNPLSMNISLSGSNILQTGTLALPYSMDSSGVEKFQALDPEQNWNANRVSAFDKLVSASQHTLEKGYKGVLDRAQSNISLLTNAIESAPITDVTYPGSNTAQQLAMVAKLASVQQVTGHQRQIFFVGMGGFDTHDNQAVNHPQLLQRLSEALAAFNSNLEGLGLSDKVTTFTMSDFGRTLTSNGDGTDHGWGGHQIIMGGAVKGGDIYGKMPEDISLDSNDDVGDGRMLPSTSVDQFSATLGKWFGLTTNEVNAVFPNLNRFELDDLGFMKT